VTKDTIKKTGQVTDSVSDKLDKVFLSRAYGIPLFLVAMYLMFMFSISLNRNTGTVHSTVIRGS
jgi:ferrous iron transport protein B